MSTSEIITLALTEEQHEALKSLVDRQGVERKGLLLASAAPFFDLDSSQVRLRLQAIFLKWPVANRVLKIIRKQKLQEDET
jgi:hypothetical protein